LNLGFRVAIHIQEYVGCLFFGRREVFPSATTGSFRNFCRSLNLGFRV
jgi:hypothetical protein